MAMLLVLGGIAIWWFIKGNEASGNEVPESENCDVRPKYVFYFIIFMFWVLWEEKIRK